MSELELTEIDALVARSIREVTVEDIESPVIRRLLEDVREKPKEIGDTFDPPPVLYNRVHNRHNRGR